MGFNAALLAKLYQIFPATEAFEQCNKQVYSKVNANEHIWKYTYGLVI